MSEEKPVSEPKVEPMDKEQLVSASKEVDAKKIASQVLKWLIKNVENYIDNQENIFLIYFTYDILDENGLSELKKLQNLYYAIPAEGVVVNGHATSIETIQEMLQTLDTIVNESKEIMDKDSVQTGELFKRLIYFYEMVGYNKLTGPIIRKYDGHVQFNHFIYEPISMPVTVTKKMKKLMDGELVDSGIPDEVVSEFVVPEGYSLELELVKEMQL